LTYRTEAESRSMPCPIARIQGDADSSGNIRANCRGSDCMFWRWRNWSDDPAWHQAVKDRQAEIRAENPDWPNIKIHKRAVADVEDRKKEVIEAAGDQRQGYCGMAGKP